MITISEKDFFSLCRMSKSAERVLNSVYADLPEDDVRKAMATKLKTIMGSATFLNDTYQNCRSTFSTVNRSQPSNPIFLDLALKGFDADKDHKMTMGFGITLMSFSFFYLGMNKLSKALNIDGSSENRVKNFITYFMTDGWSFSYGEPIELFRVYDEVTAFFHKKDTGVLDRMMNEKVVREQIEKWHQDQYVLNQCLDYETNLFYMLTSRLIHLNLELMVTPKIRELPHVPFP